VFFTVISSLDVARLPVDILDDAAPVIVLTWNKERVNEVEVAKKQFDHYLKQGWLAFAINADKIPRQIFNFNASSEKIILTPIVEGG